MTDISLHFQLISAVMKPTGGRSPQRWSAPLSLRWLPRANAWWRFNCMCFCVIMSSLLCRQMLLPEGIRRENNKMYEEVQIPPNDPMPIGFEEKPVFISELDEVSGCLFTAVDIYQCLCSHCMSSSQLIPLIPPVHIDWWHYAWNLLQMVSDAACDGSRQRVMFVFCSVDWRTVLICFMLGSDYYTSARFWRDPCDIECCDDS